MDLVLGGLKGDTVAVKTEDGTSNFTVSVTPPAGGAVSFAGRGAAATVYQSADLVMTGNVFAASVWDVTLVNSGATTVAHYVAGAGGDALTLSMVAQRLSPH